MLRHRGKASHQAVLRAQALCRRYAYYLKTDIHRYYDSVQHATLEELLGRLLRETSLRRLLATIIRHPLPGQLPGQGLPIGNLTSQWFGHEEAHDLSRHEHRLGPALRRDGYQYLVAADAYARLVGRRTPALFRLGVFVDRTGIGPRRLPKTSGLPPLCSSAEVRADYEGDSAVGCVVVDGPRDSRIQAGRRPATGVGGWASRRLPPDLELCAFGQPRDPGQI